MWAQEKWWPKAWGGPYFSRSFAIISVRHHKRSYLWTKVKFSVITTPSRKTRKRKLRARDIVERFNELTSSPLSFWESSPSSPSHDIGNVSLVADLSPLEGDCDSVVAASVCVSSSDEESVASNSNQMSDLFKSSEQIFQLPAFKSLSTISDLCSVRLTANDSLLSFLLIEMSLSTIFPICCSKEAIYLLEMHLRRQIYSALTSNFRMSVQLFYIRW